MLARAAASLACSPEKPFHLTKQTKTKSKKRTRQFRMWSLERYLLPAQARSNHWHELVLPTQPNLRLLFSSRKTAPVLSIGFISCTSFSTSHQPLKPHLLHEEQRNQAPPRLHEQVHPGSLSFFRFCLFIAPGRNICAASFRLAESQITKAVELLLLLLLLLLVLLLLNIANGTSRIDCE